MQRIPYLEMSDFNPDLTLKASVHRNLPAVCMVQGNFCGYCTKAKPDFIQFAEQVEGHLLACSIQIDDPENKELTAILPQLDPTYRGVPIYLLFDKTGKCIGTHQGGRDTNSLLNTAKQLLNK